MRLADVLATLRVAGVTLARDGGRLRFHPRDALTPNLLAALRDRRAAWFAALADAPTLDADGWADCHGCGGRYYGAAGRANLCPMCRRLRDGEPVPPLCRCGQQRHATDTEETGTTKGAEAMTVRDQVQDGESDREREARWAAEDEADHRYYGAKWEARWAAEEVRARGGTDDEVRAAWEAAVLGWFPAPYDRTSMP